MREGQSRTTQGVSGRAGRGIQATDSQSGVLSLLVLERWLGREEGTGAVVTSAHLWGRLIDVSCCSLPLSLMAGLSPFLAPTPTSL